MIHNIYCTNKVGDEMVSWMERIQAAMDSGVVKIPPGMPEEEFMKVVRAFRELKDPLLVGAGDYMDALAKIPVRKETECPRL